MTHKLILTVVTAEGDRRLFAFPYNDRVEGAAETAAERMELTRRQFKTPIRTSCEVRPIREFAGV